MIVTLFEQVPFERFSVVDTDDLDEARSEIGKVLTAYQLQIHRGRVQHCRMDLVPSGKLALLKLRPGFGAEIGIDLETQCLEDYYLLVVPTQGRAVFYFDGACIDVSPQRLFLLSPGRPFRFNASADYEHVLLRVDRRAIAQAWCRLTGHEQAPAILFDVVVAPHTAGWQAMFPMLQWVVRCAGQSNGRAVSDTLLAQTESLLATTLLLHQPHNMATLLWPAPPPALPKAIWRAQDYMMRHLGEPMPVSMIAAHCGLSVRRLQALFRESCGQSPLQWLRMQRLQAVRQQLLQPERPAKVGELALRFGFNHLGDFSRAYREAFGETPQATHRA
ncbi:helix-turn-helix domain-containing protein [Bordetella sp. 02P26C-1]|uniref:AraC-like ligand-binding domain-containing protein n=1 Tax=Bordetella sp. 02P26C-1 TaxID=2683195 RepID=UPI0013532C9C|nr:AraC family transcriptional regulator [Bordetella sp. 02P26C-1]MVW80743.1 helix-turn-helix domain-containing protein [Bordetella sp. 02P26C-1]